MDLSSLKDQVSNLTLYDLKAGVRKVQNAVMNYTEMEAKVREATNNEPWGASSTIMQEIANATHSYHLLNEIMPMIYKRFTEKAAEEWRQIYKALQLLEFLIKNGSERVIDDARSHLSLLKMLRQFHFIDQNGKDQGINVRNRSKELAELLSDVERIRAERKKARTNRNKFGGVEGGGMSSGISGGSRYGGFGSEEASGYGGYSGGVYGDGGGFGGNTSGFQDSSRRDRFEEYDEFDEGSTTSPARRKTESASAAPAARREAKKAEAPKPKEPEIDILGFDDDVPPETPPKEFSNGKKAALDNGLSSLRSDTTAADDDFDDFQSASPVTAAPKPYIPNLPPATLTSQFASPTSTQSGGIPSLASFASPTPSSTSNPLSPPAPNYNISLTSPPPQPKPLAAPTPQLQPHQPPTQKPSTYQPTQPNYFTSVPAPTPSPSLTNNNNTPNTRPSLSTTQSFASQTSTRSASTTTSAKPGGGGGDAFGNLWSSASAGAGIKKSNVAGAAGPNLAEMQREKAKQGIWGAGAVAGGAPTAGGFGGSSGGIGGGVKMQGGGGALDDLLG